MTVREFLSILQGELDMAAVRSVPSSRVIVSFIAPNSGFCGPQIRPKFLGYVDEQTDGTPAEARYGLTRTQVERVLEAFDVTLPEEHEFA
jgi:hypothetical protein